MENPQQAGTYPPDSQMLDDALEYLAALSLALEDMAEAAQAGGDVDTDSGRVPLPRALDNASLDVTERMMQWRAQRAIRDGVTDADTQRVIDALDEEDAG